MKTQVELIYEEIKRLASKNSIVGSSLIRSVTSPQFMIQFSNGSTIRFFTSGMRSGGKSDVARGQEAHIIVLDEMDYMHVDDLDALYAMLQKTAEDQIDKVLIGASTPTGRRERFWEWCRSDRFTEYYFPSYCNPYFNKEQEDEFREQYTETGYRHEIEADWGEDSEGVYPRKYVDKAFIEPSWNYTPEIQSARGFYTIGVDWDKYGAGTNIVVLEACNDNYEDERFRGKVRLVYREEIDKSEYTLTNGVNRIVQLNEIFNPRHIYVDRGYGECVSPDTLITLKDSVKKIIDVHPGDMVLTSDGQYHQVLDKVVKVESKPTYRVKVHKTLPVEVSNTHPFLTIDGTWKNITELSVGDFVALPKLNLKPAKTLIDIVELLELDPGSYDDKKVWCPNSNGYQNKVNRYIDLVSEDFLSFAGWYLSEGSADTKSVEISQNTDDLQILEEIRRVLKNISGVEPGSCLRVDKRKETYKEIERFYVCSTIFADAIGKLMGRGSHNKKIPEELMTYPKMAIKIVRTLLCGDGHLNKDNAFELSLTSIMLLDQVRLLLQTFDIPVSFYSARKGKPQHKDKWRIDIGGDTYIRSKFMELTGCQMGNEPRIDRRSFKSDDQFIYMPIRKIEYIGEVSGLVDILR